MSVLIKGMKMPSKCIECKLMRRCGKDDLDYVCMPARVYVEDLTNAYKPRPEYCPLIELPPHGRLIDADKITLTDIDLALCEDYKSLLSLYINKVESAQTIIEADKEGEQ